MTILHALTKFHPFLKANEILKQKKSSAARPVTISSISNPKRYQLHLLLAILVCIALPLIIYYPSLNAPFIFDDFHYIVENSDLKQLDNFNLGKVYQRSKKFSFLGIPFQFVRPLTFLTLVINYRFGDLNTFGYHLFNLLLHILNTILIFLLTRKILFYARPFHKPFDSLSDSKTTHDQETNSDMPNIFLPLLVALFFASHPINTEVVTYISHRSDSLGAFFYLISILFFINTFEKKKSFYPFSLVCFVLSLASKEISVTLPAILLIIDYIFLSDFKLEKTFRKKYYHLPFWLLFTVFIGFQRFYFGEVGYLTKITFETWTNYTYFITQPFVILNYLKLLLIAIGQCIDHFVEPAKSIFELRTILSFTFLGGLLLVLAYFIYRKRTFVSKLMLFSSLWFFITLAPTSSFFAINDAMAERRLYLPGFGFSLFLGCLYLLVFKVNIQENFKLHQHRIFCSFLGAHILLLSVATWHRNQLYQDPFLIWQDVIAKYPKHPYAYNELGNIYFERKEYNKALHIYQRAIELNPGYAEPYNLGNIYVEQKKDYLKALQLYEKAVEVNPNYAKAYNNLGNIYFEQRNYHKALQMYQKATELDTSQTEAHSNLGNLYYEQKQYKKALEEYKIALELMPNNQFIRDRVLLLRKIRKPAIK